MESLGDSEGVEGIKRHKNVKGKPMKLNRISGRKEIVKKWKKALVGDLY